MTLPGLPRFVLVLAVCAAPALAAEPAPNIDALVRQLADASFEKRNEASEALVKLGERALTALAAAAASPDPEVRWRAAASARRVRWNVGRDLAGLVGDVFAGYDEKKWHVRERLVADVAAVGGKSALPTLVRVLAVDKSDAVRRAAAIGLLRLGPEGLLALEQAGAEVIGLPPDSPALRIQIGNGFLEEGQYERAVKEYHKALQVAPKSSLAWYNLACALSRLKRIQEAVDALRKSLDCGYDDIDWLKKDPDLDNLRDTAPYKELLKALDERAPPPPPEP